MEIKYFRNSLPCRKVGDYCHLLQLCYTPRIMELYEWTHKKIHKHLYYCFYSK